MLSSRKVDYIFLQGSARFGMFSSWLTKSMLVSKDINLTKVILKIDGDMIKKPEKPRYLGQTITSNWKLDDDILKIIEIPRDAFNSMLKTITARHLSMKRRNIIMKNICVVDPFMWIWKVDNSDKKYSTIAIIWNILLKLSEPFSTRPSDRDQIWHACADRDETGSHLNKIDPPHPRG